MGKTWDNGPTGSSHEIIADIFLFASMAGPLYAGKKYMSTVFSRIKS